MVSLDIFWRSFFFIISACSCDPLGSEDNGECLGHSDPARGLVAGQCFCKTYVTGESCDSCQDGYYDLSADNPDGCSGKETFNVRRSD